MFATVADIAKCASFAYKLWQFGWSKAQNASAQYQEFGKDVWSLQENLSQLNNLFTNVQNSASAAIPNTSEFFNTSSLDVILDQPASTLKECDGLLHRRANFAVDSGFVSNILWNATIQADVTALHNKIKFHNVKILALLAPLQIKLLLDIKTLIIENRQDILAKLDTIEAKLSGISPLASPNEAIQCEQIQIPDYLCRRFEEASKERKPELESGNLFRLNEGIDAFLTHYKEAPLDVLSGFTILLPSQTPEQYLQLMKSIWIIQSIEDLEDYKLACNSGNRLLKLFVQGLADKCLAQFKRFAETPPGNPFKVRNEPDEATLLPLGDEAFAIWPKPIREKDDFDRASEDPLRKIVLQAKLHHPNPAKRKFLILIRHDTQLLELVTKEISETDPATNSVTKNIDLSQVSLTPVYADPNNSSPNIDVNLYPSGPRGNQDLLQFGVYKDLYLFQEAITGYLAADDLLKVKIFIRDDDSNELKEFRGRIQLWHSRNGSSSGCKSPKLPSHTPRPSDRSSSSPSSQHKSRNSFQSNTTQLSDVTSLAGTDAGVATEANQFDPIRQPYLVFFLRPQNQRFHRFEVQNMTLMRIPLNVQTVTLHTSNCHCSSSKKHLCIHTELMGPKKVFGGNGPLMVQRYTRLDMLNLALLGAHHKNSGNDTPPPDKIGFIHLQFDSVADREKFDMWFKELQFRHQISLDQYVRGKKAVHKQKDDR